MKTTTTRARETDEFVLSLKSRLANAKNHGKHVLRSQISEFLRKSGMCFTLPALLVFLELSQITSVIHERWRHVGIQQDTWKVEAMQGKKEVYYVFSITNGKRSYMYRSKSNRYCFKCGTNGMWFRHYVEIPYDLQVEAAVFEWERSQMEKNLADTR